MNCLLATLLLLPPVLFKSPGGNFEVLFRELEHKKFSPDELRRDFDRVSHVKYRLSFFSEVVRGEQV